MTRHVRKWEAADDEGVDEMLWLIGTTADGETKEPAREHCDAGTTEGAEKQTVVDDEASTTEVTAVEELGETSTKETSTLLSEERSTNGGRKRNSRQ